MRDLRGYEEKNPETLRHMTSGYPRFVVHPFSQQLAQHLVQQQGLTGHTLWLASSAKMADRLAAYLGAAHVVRVNDGAVHGVAHPDAPELASRAKFFLQHTGGFLSSRAAEDRLVHHGVLAASTPETLFPGDAAAEVRRHLAPLFSGVPAADLLLANCGMNAIDTAFRAISELQAARGRTLWIQLGWLYLDTIALLKKFAATPADHITITNLFDRAAIERIFTEHSDRIAGVIAEIPTNPLVQTPDVSAITALAGQHGAAVILDPSIASPYSLDVLPHADVVVASLTKYAANAGDLVAGLVVVNPNSPFASPLRRSVAAKIEPLYARDLARLAAEIPETEAVLAQINASVPRVVAFLSQHPRVKEVFWAGHAASHANYQRVARAPGSVGSVVTFTLREGMEDFYDRVRLPKGPSFGIKTSLLCPFMFLAHYDLVTTADGRAELARYGIDPHLLRLSVGCEPTDDLIATLGEALA
jgi:cystathionine gamma-synthase